MQCELIAELFTTLMSVIFRFLLYVVTLTDVTLVVHGVAACGMEAKLDLEDLTRFGVLRSYAGV